MRLLGEWSRNSVRDSSGGQWLLLGASKACGSAQCAATDESTGATERERRRESDREREKRPPPSTFARSFSLFFSSFPIHF